MQTSIKAITKIVQGRRDGSAKKKWNKGKLVATNVMEHLCYMYVVWWNNGPASKWCSRGCFITLVATNLPLFSFSLALPSLLHWPTFVNLYNNIQQESILLPYTPMTFIFVEYQVTTGNCHNIVHTSPGENCVVSNRICMQYVAQFHSTSLTMPQRLTTMVLVHCTEVVAVHSLA